MKPSLSATLAGVILLTAIILVSRQSQDELPTDAQSPTTPHSSSKKSTRRTADQLTPLKRLQTLTQLPLSQAPDFETVDRWASQLSDQELHDFIAESGFGDHTRLHGWLRCALYAEWGRRDPVAALAHLDIHKPGERKYNAAFDQALFSTMRGWSEIDPLAAALALERSPELRINRIYEIACENLAATDPINALELANRTADNEYYYDYNPMQGILRGLESEETLNKAIDFWLEYIWETPVTKELIQTLQTQVSSPFGGGFIRTPNTIPIFAEAALSIANHDFNQAIEFIQSNSIRGEQEAKRTISKTYSSWAERNPQKALSSLQNNQHSGHHSELANGILANDLSMAPQVLALLPHDKQKSNLIGYVISDARASFYIDDFFPTPGKNNSLRNFQQDYDDIRQLIDNTSLSEESQIELLRSLDKKFAQILPN